MDLYCPKCAEPVDNECFHDAVDEGRYSTYRAAASAFQGVGCKALGWGCNPNGNPERAAIADALYDMLGDDMDGAAAMMEDLGF